MSYGSHRTCFGILAILSREENNKQIIARDGMETLLTIMITHLDKIDVQESGCDLLWSLAFNNITIKDIIAEHGGASVVVSALKRHSKSPDFLKSACGALSNMCQSKLNQQTVAAQGGLRPLVDAISTHQQNGKLLLFIFDALASLIVGNEDNAKMVSSMGFIPLVLQSIQHHKVAMDVVKSACHTLAILSDVKGQASSVAFAGGVPVILSLLDLHAAYADLHRVAAVVLLRMLQESAHVGREVACQEGVRILLKSLDKGGAQHDTVAAVTHILFTITNPSGSPVSVESQLWLSDGAKALGATDKDVMGRGVLGSNHKGLSKYGSGTRGPYGDAPSALAGLARVMAQYCERRDVARASCRLLVNLSVYPGVVDALNRMGIVERVLDCVNVHNETKDVLESTASLLKAIHRRNPPQPLPNKAGTVNGLLTVFRCKLKDDETATACVDVLIKVAENMALLATAGNRRNLLLAAPMTATSGSGAAAAAKAAATIVDFRTSEGKTWEHEAMALSLRVLDQQCIPPPASASASASSSSRSVVSSNSGASGGSGDGGDGGDANAAAAAAAKLDDVAARWSKGGPKMVASVLRLIELLHGAPRVVGEAALFEEAKRVLQALVGVLTIKHSDLIRRTDKLLAAMGLGQGQDARANGAKKSASVEDMEKGSEGSEGALMLPKLHTRSALQPLRGGSGSGTGAAGGDVLTSRSAQGESGHGTNAAHGVHGMQLRKGFTAMRFYIVDDSTVPRKLYPLHPQKAFTSNGQAPPRLLESWPNYLEKLNVNQSISRAFVTSPSSADRMHLTYESASAAGRGVQSRAYTPVPYVVPPEGSGEPFGHSLTFDSEFESGNLLRAVQRGDASYDLFLRADLHTEGHTQWFYFAVSNTHPAALVKLSEQGVQVPPVRVRFNIVNFTKPDSLFNLGMRPVVYSCVDASNKGIGWVRSGSDISYYSNAFTRSNSAGEGNAQYYTLSFTIEFQHPKDTVLIAYSYPYSLTDYKSHIGDILARPGAADVIRANRLCSTLGGETCDLLVITNFKDKERVGPISVAAMEADAMGYVPNAASNPVPASNGLGGGKGSKGSSGGGGGGDNGKKAPRLLPCLVISCRVHPGETPASWMMKGMLDFLTGNSPQAQLIRQVFVLFIVPVLNPDGVVYGNNRCSLAGVDLNRQWKIPAKGLHPTIWTLKSFIAFQRKIRDVHMYLDLHGHSRKYNVFMYGCDEKKKSKPQVRAFPKFFSAHPVGGKYVCFADCSFHVRKGRESTARVVVSRELNIPMSFTLEATFCGSNYGPYENCHMNVGHMQEVGASLCDAILQFSIAEGAVKDALVVPPAVKATRRPSSYYGAAVGDDDLASFVALMDTHGSDQPRSNGPGHGHGPGPGPGPAHAAHAAHGQTGYAPTRGGGTPSPAPDVAGTDSDHGGGGASTDPGHGRDADASPPPLPPATDTDADGTADGDTADAADEAEEAEDNASGSEADVEDADPDGDGDGDSRPEPYDASHVGGGGGLPDGHGHGKPLLGTGLGIAGGGLLRGHGGGALDGPSSAPSSADGHSRSTSRIALGSGGGGGGGGGMRLGGFGGSVDDIGRLASSSSSSSVSATSAAARSLPPLGKQQGLGGTGGAVTSHPLPSVHANATHQPARVTPFLAPISSPASDTGGGGGGGGGLKNGTHGVQPLRTHTNADMETQAKQFHMASLSAQAGRLGAEDGGAEAADASSAAPPKPPKEQKDGGTGGKRKPSTRRASSVRDK